MPRIDHEPDANRFTARDGDAFAGAVAYERRDDVVVLTHTVVEPEAEGKGIGSALARAALDSIRAEGLRVVPQCPFVAAWIERHPAYEDLVASNT